MRTTLGWNGHMDSSKLRVHDDKHLQSGETMLHSAQQACAWKLKGTTQHRLLQHAQQTPCSYLASAYWVPAGYLLNTIIRLHFSSTSTNSVRVAVTNRLLYHSCTGLPISHQLLVTPFAVKIVECDGSVFSVFWHLPTHIYIISPLQGGSGSLYPT
jgi:hypothetical protein